MWRISSVTEKTLTSSLISAEKIFTEVLEMSHGEGACICVVDHPAADSQLLVSLTPKALQENVFGQRTFGNIFLILLWFVCPFNWAAKQSQIPNVLLFCQDFLTFVRFAIASLLVNFTLCSCSSINCLVSENCWIGYIKIQFSLFIFEENRIDRLHNI